MSEFSVRAAKRWYRDSNSISKKLIAKTRYLLSRLRVRGTRLIWSVITAPIQIFAWAILSFSAKSALSIFEKLVNRNPWILGALPGLIKSAMRTGDISIALSAALKYDRLHQKDHGLVSAIWRDYLLTNPGWELPSYQLTGNQNIELSPQTLATIAQSKSRKNHYAESELAVIAGEIAKSATSVSLAKASQQSLSTLLIAKSLGVSNWQMPSEDLQISGTGEFRKRYQNKISELQSSGWLGLSE